MNLGTEIIGIKALPNVEPGDMRSAVYSLETSAGITRGPYHAVVVAAPLVSTDESQHDASLHSCLKFEDSVSGASSVFDMTELARPYQKTNVTFIRGSINRAFLESGDQSKKDSAASSSNSVDMVLLTEPAASIEVKLTDFVLFTSLT